MTISSMPTPDPATTDESFYVLVCMFIMGCVTLGFLFRWYKQWKDPVERMMTRDEAEVAFGRLMSERIGLAIRAAKVDAIIMEKWAEWPAEYLVHLQRIIREAQILEENMYAQAAEQGIYPKRITTNGYLIPPPLPPEPDTLPLPVDAASASKGENVIELHGRKWVGGQLLKTS